MPRLAKVLRICAHGSGLISALLILTYAFAASSDVWRTGDAGWIAYFRFCLVAAPVMAAGGLTTGCALIASRRVSGWLLVAWTLDSAFLYSLYVLRYGPVFGRM